MSHVCSVFLPLCLLVTRADWSWLAADVVDVRGCISVLAIPVSAADLVLELRAACVNGSLGGCVIVALPTRITLSPGDEIVAGFIIFVAAADIRYRQN